MSKSDVELLLLTQNEIASKLALARTSMPQNEYTSFHLQTWTVVQNSYVPTLIEGIDQYPEALDISSNLVILQNATNCLDNALAGNIYELARSTDCLIALPGEPTIALPPFRVGHTLAFPPNITGDAQSFANDIDGGNAQSLAGDIDIPDNR